MRAESCEPFSWRELSDESLRMRGDTHQHVLHVVERRNADQFASLDKRIEQRGHAPLRNCPRITSFSDYVQFGIGQSIFCLAARRTIPRRQTNDRPPRRWAKDVLD
jgi:hypothetical protein